MNLETAQYLFEGIQADVVRLLVEKNGMSLNEALMTLHNSETFAKLEDFETGLYIQSPGYIHAMLLSEIEHGRLTQQP